MKPVFLNTGLLCVLDHDVAVEVMGWHIDTHTIGSFDEWWRDERDTWMVSKGAWRPSTRIEDAFKVYDWMKKEHGLSFGFWDVSIFSSVLQYPVAAFARDVHPLDIAKVNQYEGCATNPEPAIAICEAALMAVRALPNIRSRSCECSASH